jgi:hypothetical protein
MRFLVNRSQQGENKWLAQKNYTMKLWDKGTVVNELIENFTVGKDREMDLYLAKV